MISLDAADDMAGCGLNALLETKGGEPPSLAVMADLLERMCGELGQQFETFQRMRGEAERLASSGLPEAELKLAKADLKAAVDALSIIVRTLEKVDQLQRQIMRDRAEEEACPDSQEAYDRLYAGIEAMIEARVEARIAQARRQPCETGQPEATSGPAADPWPPGKEQFEPSRQGFPPQSAPGQDRIPAPQTSVAAQAPGEPAAAAATPQADDLASTPVGAVGAGVEGIGDCGAAAGLAANAGAVDALGPVPGGAADAGPVEVIEDRGMWVEDRDTAVGLAANAGAVDALGPVPGGAADAGPVEVIEDRAMRLEDRGAMVGLVANAAGVDALGPVAGGAAVGLVANAAGVDALEEVTGAVGAGPAEAIEDRGMWLEDRGAAVGLATNAGRVDALELVTPGAAARSGHAGGGANA